MSQARSAAVSRPAATRAAAPAFTYIFADEEHPEDELRLNLSDLPSRHEVCLDVEGFRQTWFSRLLDVFFPLHKR